MGLEIVAGICLVWYISVVAVCTIGYLQLLRNFSSKPPPATCTTRQESKCPHVTIIRPIKGLEPNLYDCLASSFRQTYPASKLSIRFCIASRDEPSLPILQKLLQDFPKHDAKILVEEEDPVLMERSHSLGPNPKIRNMSRAYREAKGDLVWIMDCNIWIGKGVCGRMVDKICGFAKEGLVMPYKFVHHLPIAVDMTYANEGYPITKGSGTFGARLEELFLSSSHAKFYTAINTVVIAPCIVGKSNMFRRSHLDSLTGGMGIDYFSTNICEDHLIGDLLWKGTIESSLLPPQCQPEAQKPARYSIGNHALCFGDLCIQPLANMSISAYIARRVRWLRVRKFTVTLATLVEPGTESFLCSAYGAFALVNLPFLHEYFSVPATLTTAVLFWILSVSIWCMVDFSLYSFLHSGRSVDQDEDMPSFAQPTTLPTDTFPKTRRPFLEWLKAWLGRESLAFPIWFWAVWGGVTVVWRDKRFWVGMDMKVHEIVDSTRNRDDERSGLLQGSESSGSETGISRSSSTGSTYGNGKLRKD